MPKERSINPAQAQRKAEKQKALAKSKKQKQSQLNEKLARRNPDRLQRQIDELKELEGSGTLRPKDKETLAELEKQLKGVKRAREALGEKAPTFAPQRRDGDARDEQRQRRQHLGKRRRDSPDAHQSESEDTDPEVRAIPMPRDTPPPIPRPQREPFKDPQLQPDGTRVPHALPAKPTNAGSVAQTVYSSAPVMRDLKKEAIRFMPSVVAQQKRRLKGEGGKLLEPEELDKLEQSGYGLKQAAKQDAQKAAADASLEARYKQVSAEVRAEDADDMEAEARRFEEEIAGIYPEEAEQIEPGRGVQMEEVEDEDA